MMAMLSRVSALSLLIALPLLAAPVAAGAAPSPANSDSATAKQLPGGAVLHFGPGTRFELARPLKLPLGAPGSPDTVTQVIKLSAGRVEVDIPPSKTQKTAVLLEGPHKASALAKSGHSIAIVDGDRVTFAAVEGDMLSASGNDWKPMPSGVVRSFIGGDPTPQSHPVPGVPTVNLTHPLMLALGDHQASAKVAVSGVAQAEHYELSVYRVSDKAHDLVRHLDARQASSEISDLQPGRYEVTARAVDSTGIAGKDSSPQTLRVVGGELPEGARLENGAVLLGQHSRMKLIAAEGLEASYGTSSHFVRAPGTVGLAHGEGTVLRLREAGSSDELKVALELRALHADVEISPKSAHWPQDKIDVSVRLFDARGQAVSEAVKVKTTVLVNVQPVEVSWTRSGNTLSAQIPAATGRGPWVVRVEVSDEFGDPAGRDFLEVAGADSGRISAR